MAGTELLSEKTRRAVFISGYREMEDGGWEFILNFEEGDLGLPKYVLDGAYEWFGEWGESELQDAADEWKTPGLPRYKRLAWYCAKNTVDVTHSDFVGVVRLFTAVLDAILTYAERKNIVCGSPRAATPAPDRDVDVTTALGDAENNLAARRLDLFRASAARHDAVAKEEAARAAVEEAERKEKAAKSAAREAAREAAFEERRRERDAVEAAENRARKRLRADDEARAGADITP